MTREAGLCCGLSTVMASRLAPGCHDASCTLVVKLSSATTLSLLAGQPKLTRASLLTQVSGMAVRRPLAMDASSSCTAIVPSSVSSLKPTWITRKLPSGLKAALATELASGSSTDTCRPVAGVVSEAHLDHQEAAIGAEGGIGDRTRLGQLDRYLPAGGQIQHLHTTACGTRRRPGDLGCARRDHSDRKAALATELASGSSTDTCRPVARFSTCTRQRAAHGGAQAIWVALAAITPAKARLGCGAAGSHNLSAIIPGNWAAGASSRPRSVPRSIRYPAGSVICGPIGRPAMLTSRARPVAVSGSASGG